MLFLGPKGTIQKEPEGPPEFVELLKSATTTINGTAVLKCKVKGNPRPTLQWLKDGQKIEENARIKMEYHDDGVIILTIKVSFKKHK